MSKIRHITPFKENITLESLREETLKFISKILTPEKLIEHGDIVEIFEEFCGIRLCKVFMLKDGSSWIQGSKGIERIIGSHYLSEQLEELSLDSWKAVETKYIRVNPNKKDITFKYTQCSKLGDIPVIDSQDVITLSRYVGDNKPKFHIFSELFEQKLIIMKMIEFTDMPQQANLRELEDGSITIIDTEYGSFSNKSEAFKGFDISTIGDEEFNFSLSEISETNIIGSDI